jgi:signal transduction histidine kinase
MRRFVFWRLAGLFSVLFLLFLAVLGIVLVVAFDLPQTGLQASGLFVLLACGLPVVFFALTVLVGGWAFRRIGRPVADLMAAADAVANGDLSARVREDTPGQLGRLATSFNRMTSELARAEQQRRNLTADVAHELRNPLHVIQGNLEGILDGVYEPSPGHIGATLEETRLLARLVTDLQTLSLAEAGQLPLHPIRISVADLLSDVATSSANQAAEQGVELSLDLAPGAEDLELTADSDRLDQVLSNLVANALRYTPAGGRITLGAEARPGGVRLRVADTGAGIPAEDLPFIFDRFWRGDRSRTRQAGAGSGLGLAIAKQLVQAHGGTISASSQPGQGTVFTIDL